MHINRHLKILFFLLLNASVIEGRADDNLLTGEAKVYSQDAPISSNQSTKASQLNSSKFLQGGLDQSASPFNISQRRYSTQKQIPLYSQRGTTSDDNNSFMRGTVKDNSFAPQLSPRNGQSALSPELLREFNLQAEKRTKNETVPLIPRSESFAPPQDTTYPAIFEHPIRAALPLPVQPRPNLRENQLTQFEDQLLIMHKNSNSVSAQSQYGLDRELERKQRQPSDVPAPQRMDTQIALQRAKAADVALAHDLIDEQVKAELMKTQREPSPELLVMVKRQLAKSKESLQSAINAAQSSFASVIRIPVTVSPPNMVPTASIQQGDREVDWDEWYARFAALSKPRLMACMAKQENPRGLNTVLLAVGADHSVHVLEVSGSSPSFNAATAAAYSSLNSSPQLAFPRGSTRRIVKFFVDNEHAIDGDISEINAKTCTGDVE